MIEKKNVLIVGYGQIGRSLEQVYSESIVSDNYKIYTVDTNSKEKDVHPPRGTLISVMHVCFPYSKSFVKNTLFYINKYFPEITIIHSSVPVYTTSLIVKKFSLKKSSFSKSPLNIVHSPVMGKHPNLKESLLTFKKIIGGYEDGTVKKVSEHFQSLGIKSVCYGSPEESEAAKLLDTSYYAWNILFMRRVHDFCNLHGLSFENVYSVTNNIYNDGYKSMGLGDVTRPILKYQGVGFGGHCVLENAVLLHEKGFFKDVSKKIISEGKSNLKKDYNNRTYLYIEYIGKNKTMLEIANEFDVPVQTIKNLIISFDIPMKDDVGWSEKDDILLEELLRELSIKEIYERMFFQRTYDTLFLRALKLKAVSSFDGVTINGQTNYSVADIPIDSFEDFIRREDDSRGKASSYLDWRAKVFERDDYTCQKYPCSYCSNKKGAYLHAHHLKPFLKDEKLMVDVDNGVTYCREQHIKDIHYKIF